MCPRIAFIGTKVFLRWRDLSKLNGMALPDLFPVLSNATVEKI